MVSIYSLTDPRSGEVRYIGKTKKALSQRLAGHMYTRGQSTHKSNWIDQLKAIGMKPTIELLETCSVDAWREAERRYIREFRARGARLTNLTPGGDGLDSFTPEMIAKIAKANTGKKKSESSKQLMRIAKIGKPLSESHKRAIGRASEGKIQPKEHVQKRVERRQESFRERVGQITPIILAMYADGCSQQKIHHVVHMAKSEVRKILIANGIDIRDSKTQAHIFHSAAKARSI